MLSATSAKQERERRKASHTLRIAGQKMVTVSNDATVTDCVRNIIESRLDTHQSDAFHMFSLSSVLYKWRHWFYCMPKIHPYYAVKANPDAVLLRLLAMLGANFDCASRGEIERILALDVEPERIIFANTTKPISSILFAKEFGVDLMTVDNIDELHKIKAHYPDARCVIRIREGDPTALVKLTAKFGVDPHAEAEALLHSAVDMGLHVVGVSFHVGGGCNDISVYESAIGHARRLFNLAETRGQRMTLLDIGGGYPGYCNEKIGAVVTAALERHFGDRPDLVPIAEPGRYFAMPSACVVAQIFAKKEVKAVDIKDHSSDPTILDTAKSFMYYLTDGVFGSFNCTPVYRIRPPFIVLDRNVSSDGDDSNPAVRYPSRIWGPTCDSADLLFKCIALPELIIGDWLLFQGMGAYSMCIASEFNGIPPPRVHYVITESDKTYVADLLRKRIASTSTLRRPTELNTVGEQSDSATSPLSDDADDDTLITKMVFSGRRSRVLRASTSIAK